MSKWYQMVSTLEHLVSKHKQQLNIDLTCHWGIHEQLTESGVRNSWAVECDFRQSVLLIRFRTIDVTNKEKKRTRVKQKQHK